MANQNLSIDSSIKHATREAFGATLLELLDAGKNVCAVEADLSGSTTTKKIKDKYAERLINCGIAEANMIDVAAGLSLEGFTPFTGSFAVFGTGRCYDQIRNTVCYSNLNVKICPTHAGVSVGPDGGTHQMLEDVALMSVLPNMKVIVPSDYNSACAALRLVEGESGPAYVRMGRAKVGQVYAEDVKLTLGGSFTLREGSDVTIVANGVEVAEALLAADILSGEGIEAEVIDAYSVKPLDVSSIEASLNKTQKLIVCEEHSIYGGLCSIVSTALSEKLPVQTRFVAVRDQFGTSAEFEELMVEFGLDAQSIAKAAHTFA